MADVEGDFYFSFCWNRVPSTVFIDCSLISMHFVEFYYILGYNIPMDVLKRLGEACRIV